MATSTEQTAAQDTVAQAAPEPSATNLTMAELIEHVTKNVTASLEEEKRAFQAKVLADNEAIMKGKEELILLGEQTKQKQIEERMQNSAKLKNDIPSLLEKLEHHAKKRNQDPSTDNHCVALRAIQEQYEADPIKATENLECNNQIYAASLKHLEQTEKEEQQQAKEVQMSQKIAELEQQNAELVRFHNEINSKLSTSLVAETAKRVREQTLANMGGALGYNQSTFFGESNIPATMNPGSINQYKSLFAQSPQPTTNTTTNQVTETTATVAASMNSVASPTTPATPANANPYKGKSYKAGLHLFLQNRNQQRVNASANSATGVTTPVPTSTIIPGLLDQYGRQVKTSPLPHEQYLSIVHTNPEQCQKVLEFMASHKVGTGQAQNNLIAPFMNVAQTNPNWKGNIVHDADGNVGLVFQGERIGTMSMAQEYQAIMSSSRPTYA